MSTETEAAATMPALPANRTQATPDAVVEEHFDALNASDWTRLVAQIPDDAEIFMPGGAMISGRQAVAEMFFGFCQPYGEGGMQGMSFVKEHVKTVGNTVNVQWCATAPFLAEPYRGADAYVTRDGLLVVQVATFDGAALKFKS